MEKIIYAYDLDKVFINETVEKISPLDGSRIVPQFYTEIKPVFNNNTHFAIFDEGSQSWNYKEFSPIGVLYNKQTMDKIEVKSQLDLRYSTDLYTDIIPLQEYDDGSIQAFNEELQTWEYTEKGATLLEKERIEALEVAKKEHLAQLENDYNASKVITIQNGNTIVIKHDTFEREHFLKNIELVGNETTQTNTVLSYRQNDIENRCQYRISLVYYIWKYIFIDLFLVGRSSGFKESIRSKNQGEYTIAQLKIANVKTIEELNGVTCNFVNPQGTVIDVSVKAKKIFDNSNTPDDVKALISKLTDAEGNVHLIEKVLW